MKKSLTLTQVNDIDQCSVFLCIKNDMRLKNNTILITGGSSGIGLQLARVLLDMGNKVLVCGRSEEKLQLAKEQLPELHTFSCDLSASAGRALLHQWVTGEHSDCNILINNAALVHKTDFQKDEKMIDKAELEIATNLCAPIVLTKLFLPLLERNEGSAIINITTGLVYTPRAAYPIYNATKAGLHAFSQVLRHQLKDTSPLQVIEVLMTVVDTPWHQGEAPKIAISVEKAVAEMLRELEGDKQEIRIGKVKLLYLMSRIAPGFIFRKLNSLS